MKFYRLQRMIFCPTCDNTFSYRENTEERTLEHHCPTCNVSRPLVNNCLSSKTFKQEKIETDYQDVHFDKTLPRCKETICTKCKKKNLSYLQNDAFQIVYVCRTPQCENVM